MYWHLVPHFQVLHFQCPLPHLHVCVVRCFWFLCARLQAAVVARGTSTHSHPASLYTDTCMPFSLHRYYRITQTLKSKIEPRAHYALEPVQGHGASCGSLWNSWALCHTVHRELQHKGSDNSADTGVRLWTNKEMCDCCNAWRTKIRRCLSFRTTTLHPFNGLFSMTIWLSRYQKGKTSLDLNEARVG